MCITLPLGVLFLTIGLVQFGRSLLLLFNGLTVPGRVVTMVNKDSGRQMAYYPLVSFRTRAGQDLQFTGTTGGRISSYEPNEPVRVIYDPAKPENATIRSFSELWLGAVIWSILGAGCLFAALSGKAKF